MTKRFTACLTTLILSVFFSISALAYDVEVDGIYYNLIPKGNIAEVTKGDNKYSGDVKIPSLITVNKAEYTVTNIGSEAFFNCFLLTSVTIPNSVTSIGDYAFSYCSYLTSITIPNSVTSIGDYAFKDCSCLTSITIPNSVTSIGGGAFLGCSGLTSITIPNSVTSIGGSAFMFCDGLTSIIIPNSVTSIGGGAFRDCSSLTSVTIPNSVTSIGGRAFRDCSSLTSVTIPNSVTSIESEAFKSCSKLENVYCYVEKKPYTGDNIFEDSYIEYATLHVPSSAISFYRTTAPWSGFGTIKVLEGTDVETKKCEAPTISFAEGKLTFSCATEGVEYVSEVTCSDVSKYYSNVINLTACYDISVTAMKTGYVNSDIATAKLYWLTSSGSLEGDGINNVSMRGIAIQSAGGFINLSGLDNNETVSFYALDGKALGTAKSIDGNVSFSAKQGIIVVARIGKESVKIAVE